MLISPFRPSGKAYFKEGIRSGGRKDIIGASQNFENALKNFEKLNDSRLIAVTNLNLAGCYMILRKNRDSLARFDNVIFISRENGYEKYEAKALRGSSLLFNHLDQHDMGLARMEGALSIHRRLDNKKEELKDNIMMGIMEIKRDSAEAGIHFRRALELSKKIGDPVMELSASSLFKRWRNGETERIRLVWRPPTMENM